MNRRLIRKTLFIVAIMFAAAFAIFHAPLRLGLDLRGGVSLILRVKAEGVSRERQREVVEQTRRILERRINAYGLSEAPVQPYGSRGNELLVQLPGVSDPSRLQNLLQSPGVLEWYPIEGGPYSDPTQAVAQQGGMVPFNRKMIATKPAPGQERSWYLVDSQPVVRGTDLRDAQVAAGTIGQLVIAFTLSHDGAARFQQYTKNNIGRRCAIVLDQEILSAPVIEAVIRDSGQIRGPQNLEEAADLAANLRAGALPAAIEVVQERTVGASLGADSIRHGLQAGAAGLAAVVAAMMLYYRRAGANAILALLLNGVLLLAALCCFGAVLTLPGIAGAILTIGMAVDSNVLIFERIREELRAGKTAPAAVAAGFSKAFATLVDTHVTTIISCFVLFFCGTPSVRGFAATLAVGLVTNLFTSVSQRVRTRPRRLTTLTGPGVKEIIFTPPARADVRRIDRDTAMRILNALDRFARTGEGDIKKLEGNTGELRLRVGNYRVRFIENRTARSTFTPSCTVPKPTAERRSIPVSRLAPVQ